MMDTIDENILLLLDAVKKSDIYLEYKKQEENLCKNEELKHRVEKFRADNYRIQNECERDQLFTTADQLVRESADIRRYPEVNAYLDAELALCRMMQKICWNVMGGIDMHIPEL